MKISHNWLKNYININEYTIEEIAETLTDCGLEVESTTVIESIKGGLKDLVIGEIITKEKHPDADKLSLTTVKINENLPLLSIVCGAPNVAAGQKVIVAPVGCTIFPINEEPFKINKSKIRGQVSEGMICAEDEVGLGKAHDGIVVLPASAKIGTLVADYYKIETDVVFEIGLTPNRVDASSHYGVARDLLAVLNHKTKKKHQLVLPLVTNFEAAKETQLKVEVTDAALCPRYSSVVISNIKVAPSPVWLQNKLKAIGLSPINNIVDITNFVLHETGQPLHAFDTEKIAEKNIIVKTVAENTPFITLDGTERKLNEHDLMICDAQKPLCIAGVFGGLDSGMNPATTSVFLESAYFNPVSVRKSAKRHGLNTDASFRFERGTDPEMTIYALKRAALLIQEIAGGKVTSLLHDFYPTKIKPFEVDFSIEKCQQIIGKKIDAEIIKSIITSLGITILSDTDEQLKLAVPPYRVDVTREIDVVEEVLRIYGYNNIEIPSKMVASLAYKTYPDKEKTFNILAGLLVNKGFNEILSNSLTKKNYYPENSKNLVQLVNPLSNELGVLRQTLLFNGLETIVFNQNRKNADLLLFEFGKTYLNIDDKFNETYYLGLFVTGNKMPENWNTTKEKVDFYYLKGIVNVLLERVGIKLEKLKSEETQSNQFIYGLDYLLKNKKIVEFGEVNTAIQQQFEIATPVFYAQLNLDVIFTLISSNISYQPVTKFPTVRRDLSFLLETNIRYEELRKIAFQQNNILLKAVNLFDVYEGKNIEIGKKSYTLSFIFQDNEKTLTDEAVDTFMNKLIAIYKDKMNIVFR